MEMPTLSLPRLQTSCSMQPSVEFTWNTTQKVDFSTPSWANIHTLLLKRWQQPPFLQVSGHQRQRLLRFSLRSLQSGTPSHTGPTLAYWSGFISATTVPNLLDHKEHYYEIIVRVCPFGLWQRFSWALLKMAKVLVAVRELTWHRLRVQPVVRAIHDWSKRKCFRVKKSSWNINNINTWLISYIKRTQREQVVS